MKFRGRGAQRMPAAERRRRATEATLNRYRGKAMSWQDGITCVHMARYHLRQMGHRPPGMPRFRSALAARRALADRGWSSTTEMLDSLLKRIPPAAMLPGDLATVAGEGGLDAIVICAGPGRVFGWREDAAELVVLGVKAGELSAAWRV